MTLNNQKTCEKDNLGCLPKRYLQQLKLVLDQVLILTEKHLSQQKSSAQHPNTTLLSPSAPMLTYILRCLEDYPKPKTKPKQKKTKPKTKTKKKQNQKKKQNKNQNQKPKKQQHLPTLTASPHPLPPAPAVAWLHPSAGRQKHVGGGEVSRDDAPPEVERKSSSGSRWVKNTVCFFFFFWGG